MHHHVPNTTLLLRTFAAPVELRTPRVLLRQWKDSDAEAWAVMHADPEVRRYFPSVLNRADAQAEADRIRSAINRIAQAAHQTRPAISPHAVACWPDNLASHHSPSA